MKRLLLSSVALCLLVSFSLLASCAIQPPKVSSTRWPQAVINAPKALLHDDMLSAMASNGGSIDATTDSMIQASFPDDNATMQKMFFGCATCADPYIKTTAIFTTVSDGTLVVLQYWRMIPQPNGSATRYEIDDAQTFNKTQQMLWQLRDKLAAKPATNN